MTNNNPERWVLKLKIMESTGTWRHSCNSSSYTGSRAWLCDKSSRRLDDLTREMTRWHHLFHGIVRRITQGCLIGMVATASCVALCQVRLFQNVARSVCGVLLYPNDNTAFLVIAMLRRVVSRSIMSHITAIEEWVIGGLNTSNWRSSFCPDFYVSGWRQMCCRCSIKTA